jgi:wobble nucleotide-excising tRNase
MESEYIIVNKTDIQKRIEELEYKIQNDGLFPQEIQHFKGQIKALNDILSQSTPLIPEIEKSWEHGYARGYNLACCEEVNSDCLTPNKQDYISNLKLDI